jgi:hypothetical protein
MTMIMAARSDIHHRLARAATLVAAAVLCALSLPATADVRIVDSGAGRVVVEARDATVEQVLEALSESRTFGDLFGNAAARARAHPRRV